MITTILVALSSSEVGKAVTRLGLGIRTAAIVFPALGTAVAAIIAFYDPNETLARQSQVSTGLQQLHAQISSTLWTLNPVIKPNEVPSTELLNRLQAWNLRYQELIANVGDARPMVTRRRSRPEGLRLQLQHPQGMLRPRHQLKSHHNPAGFVPIFRRRE